MAEEWRQAFARLGQPVHPLVSYPCTGAGNADLPEFGEADGKPVRLADLFAQTSIAVGMCQFSATAPLMAFARKLPAFRAASMPNVLRRMEKSALAADYAQVARKCEILRERLARAESARLVFATGHEVTFDLRYRTAKADDGQCRGPGRVINLPSGETFIVPYEGERAGEPSRTAGEIPVGRDGEVALLHVAANVIERVTGTGPLATHLRALYDADPARRNIAELGLGCNDRAIVTGNVLEDEKAGLHWAYGRSEHLGGTVGPDRFLKPENVLHHDIVYARGCPIAMRLVTLAYRDGTSEEILQDGDFVVFPKV
jgi:hypothetical protein